MTDIRRDYHETEKPKFERLVQTIINELQESAVYILVGKAEQEKSKLMLSVAIEMLKNNNLYRIVYLKAPSGLFFGHVTVHDDLDTPFLPEFGYIYQWLFQVVGEDTTKDWLTSGQFAVASIDNMFEQTKNADVILLDEIHNMNIKNIHQIIEDHKYNQKILMTYESENAVFTDLVINELESVIHVKKPEAVLKVMLIDEKAREAIEENSQQLTSDLFEHLNISEIDMEVLDHNHVAHLIFDVRDNHLELRDFSQPEGLHLVQEEIAKVTRLKPEIQLQPIELGNSTNFWGRGANASIKAILSSTESVNEALNEDEIEYQEIVMEKVSSDFWGDYKVHVLKALTVNEVEQLDWKQLKRSKENASDAESTRMRLSIDSQNKYLVDKVVGADLLDSNHKIIAKKGEVITVEIIEKATLSNVLVELILNMTLPELEGTYE